MPIIEDDDLITVDMLSQSQEPQETFECDFDDEIPQDGVNVLSLFDGMACGMIAFKQADVPVKSYEAYEIDTACRKNVKKNFPNIKERGDVFKADFTQYKGKIDYLIGGSPCTYWSIAQSPDKRETTAEGIGWELFSQYVRALREAKPDFFIYENNKSMSNEIRQSITETFGFEPICINSALVSAQNRQRLYWVGRRNEDGTYSKVDVQQPKDRGILLKDILDKGADLTTNEKSYTLTAHYGSACPFNTIERSQRTMVVERIPTYGAKNKSRPVIAGYSKRGDGESCLKADAFPDNPDKQLSDFIAEQITDKCAAPQSDMASRAIKRVGGLYEQVTRWGIYDEDGIAPTLTASMGMGGGHIPMVASSEPIKCFDFPHKDGSQTDGKGYRVYDENGKAVTLCAEGGGMGAKSGLYAISTDGKRRKVYKVKDGVITIKNKQYPIKLKDGYYIIRKLTVEECKELQTVPQWYDFSSVSDSQAYKMLGNGWTVEVIKHLIEATLK